MRLAKRGSPKRRGGCARRPHTHNTHHTPLLRRLDDFWDFWRDPWNVFDFFVTALSVLPGFVILALENSSGGSTTAAANIVSVAKNMRILRTLRTLKMVARLSSLKIIVITILEAFQSLTFIIMLLFLILYIFVILGACSASPPTPPRC